MSPPRFHVREASPGARVALPEHTAHHAREVLRLRAGAMANLGFAQAAGVPVVLVGAIDRGGVIARIAGTWLLLEAAERARLEGCIVNKFRGDPALFEDGLQLPELTGFFHRAQEPVGAHHGQASRIVPPVL